MTHLNEIVFTVKHFKTFSLCPNKDKERFKNNEIISIVSLFSGTLCTGCIENKETLNIHKYLLWFVVEKSLAVGI